MKKLTYKTVMALIGAVVLLIQNLGVRVDVEAVNAVSVAISATRVENFGVWRRIFRNEAAVINA